MDDHSGRVYYSDPLPLLEEEIQATCNHQYTAGRVIAPGKRPKAVLTCEKCGDVRTMSRSAGVTRTFTAGKPD